LNWLISYILEEGSIHDEHEFSFEGHPNNTTAEHLQTLFDSGFKRVSFGVQDLDPKVQQKINRIQPFENLQRVTKQSRAIGYKSLSFDLIYGLPFQTNKSIEATIRQVLTLRPDRVSFYSYAHVPWVSPGQRGYSEADLPSDIEKRMLYESGRRLLKESGYEDIGMDHFALPHDTLFIAQTHDRLQRNFMGYTTTNTDLLLGLGASAISDAKYAYAQNVKKVENYSASIAQQTLPIFKGHIHTTEDLSTKQTIMSIACQGRVRSEDVHYSDDPVLAKALKEMLQEGILKVDVNGYVVTDKGRAFVRNICSLFDRYLTTGTSQDTPLIFSKSI
jgi:oxygen-independent coproporphyrinogen III oxidase